MSKVYEVGDTCGGCVLHFSFLRDNWLSPEQICVPKDLYVGRDDPRPSWCPLNPVDGQRQEIVVRLREVK